MADDMPYDRIRERELDERAHELGEPAPLDPERLQKAGEWELFMAQQRERRLLAAVVAIWTHTETHTTYKPGGGYRWQTGDPPCGDVPLHEQLSIEEGEAWHAYRRSLK